MEGKKAAQYEENAQDIRRVYRTNITFSPSGAVSDGHVPVTHHRPIHPGIMHMSSRLFLSLRGVCVMKRAVFFVVNRHLAALTRGPSI